MIDKYDIKKAILGGKISLSDVASTSRFTSRPDRYDFGPKIEGDRRRQEKSRIPEEEAKKPEMEKAEESGSSKSKETKQPEVKQQDDNGSKYNFIADSYKLWLVQRNENQFQAAMGKIKSEVVPNISLVSGIYDNQKNPEFYRYLREYDKIAKKDENAANMPLEESLRRQRETYAANGLNEWGQGTISQGKKPTWFSEFGDWFSEKYERSPLEGLVKTVGSAATLTAAIYAAGFGIPGVVIGGMLSSEAKSLALTGRPEDPIEVLSSAADFLPMKGVKEAKMAMKGLLLGGAGTLAGLGISEFGSHSSAPKGYRNVQEWELPEDLRKYHNDFSPIAYQWSRADKYLDGVIPNINDVVSGAPIEGGWEEKAAEVIRSKYKEYENEAMNNVKDKENLTFLGIGIGQPSEKALQLKEKGDEDVYKYGLLTKEGWMSNMSTWGGSSTEMESQAISTAVAFSSYAAAGKLAKANTTVAVLASALAPLITGATYAYTNKLSREAETFAGLSTSFDEKQNEYLEKNGVNLEIMSDEELISLLPSSRLKASYASGQLEPGERDEIIRNIKLGAVITDNPVFKKSIEYANEQSDEFIRQYMAMLPADMLDNVLLNAVFSRPSISKSVTGANGVASMFGNAAKSASDFTRASFVKRATKGVVSKSGKLLAKTAKYKLLSAAEEVFLEETPQMVIDEQYKANVLAENKNVFGSMIDMYSSANTGLMSMLGLSNDERYWSGAELRENALRTLYSTLVMESANINTVLDIKRGVSDLANDVYAEKLITGTVLDEMRRTNRESMTDLYVRNMSEGKQNAVLNRMTEILDNLPEGVSRDDMENEIATARKTFQVANSKEVKEYAKRGAGLYSTDHKTLVSLAMDHYVAKGDNEKIRTEKAQKFEEQAKAEFKNSDFYSSIKSAASQANVEISDSQIYNLYMLKAGLEAVNAIKFVDTDNNKFSARKIKRMESSVKNQMENYKNSIEFVLSTMIDANGNRLELDMDDLSVDSPSTLTLAEAIAAKAGADYEQSMYNVLTGKTKNTKDNTSRDAEIDEYLDAYRAARAKDEDYAKTAEEYELAKREVINNPVVKDEVIGRADPLEPENVVEPEKIDPAPKVEPSTDAENKPASEPITTEEFPSVQYSPGESIPASVDVEESESDLLNEAANIMNEPGSSDVVSENKEDKPEATNEESTESANAVAADAIEESNIAAELLEDEDSSGFYELEEEFPGSTESAKVDSKFDKLSHTLFTPNKKSQEFLKNPDALEGAKVRITVSRIPDANVPGNRRNPNDVNPYKSAFDINNKSTWDEAWIEVEIKSPKYGTHRFSISLPDVAQFRSKIILADGTIKDKFTQEEIATLKDYRASIIGEYKKVEEARGKKHLVATKISRGKAKISLNRVNGRAIQRPLGAIKGLIEGFTGKNWESVGVKSITLAYGRGARGLNTVVGVDGVYGTTLEQNSGSIFAVKSDPLTGEPRNIKLNKLRMKDDNGIAELIYKLVVDFGASRRQIAFNKAGEIDVAASGDIAELGLTVQKLLMSIVRFGEDTIVPANMREKFKHLIPKQFFVENGILTFGENTMSISNPDIISAADKQALIDYIKENFHWTIDKDMLWNEQGGDNRVSDVFPSLRGYFNSNKNVKSVKFSDGFEISREDMGLTWTGWLIKNGKMVSDLGDGVFDAPFTYLNDVRATQIVKPGVSIIEESESLKTPENASNDIEAKTSENPTDTTVGTIFDMKANKKIIVGKPAKIREYEYEAGSPDQEVEWIKSILGNEIAVEVYDHALTMDNGVEAMGAMIGDSILLWEGAEKGTGFHEAFHFVSLMVLPRNRRMMVYESVRNSVVGMKDATNSEIEEYLAEEYRDFMLHSKNGIQNKKRPNIIRTTFRRIMNAIRAFAGLDNNSKERLFKDISMGLYANRKPSYKNMKEFRLKYGDGAARMLKDKPYKAIKTLDLQYSIAKGLTNMMLSISNVRESKDIENINKSKWDEMRGLISNTVSYMEQRPEEFSQETVDVYKDIRDTFDSEFVPLIKKEMKSMSIVESPDSDSDESIIGQELARFDKADYQISRKNSVPAEVKFFISTIDRLVEVEGGAESYVNPVTMMKEFVDPDISWKKLIDDLHDEYGFEMMMDKINELANNGDLYYLALREKMNDVSEDLKTKFFVSIFSHRHDFINISYNPAATSDNASATVQLIDAKLDSAKRKMPKVWGENFISNGFIYSEIDGVLSFNKDNASSLLSSYEKLQSKYNKVKNNVKTVSDDELISDINEYVADLNLIGVSVDAETINSYMNFKYKGLPKDEAFARVITDAKASSPSLIFSNILTSLVNNDGKVMVTKRKEAKDKKDVFKGSKAVETLAKSFAKTHPVPQEAISIGADGAKVYEIALRNYIINTVTKLNKNKQYLSGLKNVSYVAGEVIPNGGLNGSDAVNGSIILNQLLNGPTSELQVKTFLKFYKDRSGDKGRDYFGISKLEDYIIKMAAAINGYVVLPAMADKKTYYFLSGITMPNFIENPITYNADGTMVFPVESLRILDGYFNAEYIAIKDAWNEYVEHGGNKGNLIDVYHVNGVNQRGANQFTNKKGAWNSGLGNGMHFRHFDQMYVRKSDGSSVSVNLNDVMESYIADMGLENGMNAFFEFMEFNYFGDGSHSDRLKMINSTIVSAMKTEISWLRDTGAVSVNGRNIENVSLDNVLVEKMYSEFIAQAAASGIKTSAVDFSRNASVLNMVAANLMNTYISNIEFEKLFSKDPAFYKDPDAKTKRLSSPLSTTTSLRTDFPVGHELHGKNSFISAELLDNEIASAQIEVLRAKMTAAQFNELMRQSGNEPIYDMDRIITDNGEELQRIKDEFKKQFDAAEKLARKAYAGYERGINETDATVYISPSMYRSILIRLGRWDDKTKEAFKLIQSDDVSWMTDDAKYLEVIDVLFNPLKMIYFGSSFKGNLEVPKLDKMAMFPLFKSIATGDLEALYNRMNHPAENQRAIDMVAFNSAVKVGNNHPISFYEDESNTSISDLGKLREEEQYFEYLGHQLETEPHHGAMVNMATQVQKVGMSNIDKSRLYSNIKINGQEGASGSQLIEEWKNAIVELSNRGVTNIHKKLGIKEDESTGDLTVDKALLYKFLVDEANKSDMPDDVVSMLESFDSNDLDSVSLQALFDDAWVESKIASYVMKETIDIETPGGMFIQMSAFGVKSIDDKNHEYRLNGGKRLNFMNPDGSMDAVVSLSLFKDIIPADIQRKSPKKQKEWLILHNIIGENANPIAMGYRIPTQGLSSISGLRIVDVLPANIGDTIVLPSEFTKLTGSDFDVDKLFVSRHNFKRRPSGRIEKVEFDDSIENKWSSNSTEAIQNRLLDVLLAVITEPMSVHETRIPLDNTTDILKSDVLADIESISPKSKTNQAFKFISPSYQTDKKSEYSSAKRNLGPFALANTHHVLTQIAELKFKDKGIAKKFSLTNIGAVYGRDGIRVLDWLSAMINAHVDIAKDPYIVRLGVNSHTIKHAIMLLRTGVGKDTFYFLSQPALKELYSIMDKYSGEYGVTADKNDLYLDASVDMLIDKYRSMAEALAKSDKELKALENAVKIDKYGRSDAKNSHVLKNENLREWMQNQDKESFWWAYHQMQVLYAFKEMSPLANELAELIKYSQIDTKKAGTSFSDQRSYLEGMYKIIYDNAGKSGLLAGVADFFKDTFLMDKSINSIGTVMTIGQGLLFRTAPSIISAARRISTLSMGNRKNKADLESNIFRYIDSKIKSEFYDKFAKDNGISVEGLFFGENSVAKKLYRIKRDIANGKLESLRNNEFIKNITYILSGVEGNINPDYITVLNSNSDDPNISEKIKNYFNELLTSSDPELVQFAKEFILYQFYTSGDNKTLNYVKISEEDRKSIGYYRFINEKMQLVEADELPITDSDIDDIYLNRWYDNNLVPIKKIEISKGQEFDQITGTFIESKEVLPNISAPSKLLTKGGKVEGAEYALAFVDKRASVNGISSDGVKSFVPYVKVLAENSIGESTYVLYKLFGTVLAPGRDSQNERFPVYLAVDKKGDRSLGVPVVEYNSESSVLSKNILPSKADPSTVIELFRKNRPTSQLTLLLDTFTPVNHLDAMDSKLDFSDEDMNYGDSDSDVVDIAIDNAISSKDYSIEHIDSSISNEGISDTDRINNIRALYAEAILRRFKDFNNQDGIIDQDEEESGLNELRMRIEAYMQPYLHNRTEPANSTVASSTSSNSPSEYTNHSGGAYGGDTFWDIIGREFGVTNHKHYKDAGNANLSQQLRNNGVKAEILTKEQMDFARQKVKELLGIEYENDLKGNLQVRNFYQVYNADAVYAIAELNSDDTGVKGGTNTAVKLGIKLNKPVYVWDIVSENWWVSSQGGFTPYIDENNSPITPVLTKNFAGVGSRDIENYNVQKDGKWQPREEYVGIEKENAAKQAIRDVYEKTLTENNPGRIEENVDNGSVNIEFYEENGTLYQFISEPGESMTGQYKQQGQDWKDLSNPEKTLRRLKSGKTPQVEAQSSPSIAATPATARKISIFGKSLDLSKIGINFDLNNGQQSAIDAVSEWFATETNEPFVIKGYAGTGKTSITRIITSGLSASGIKFKVAAFTHQAKKVASKATKSKAVTLFSLLSMQHISSEAEVGGASKFSEATSEKIPYDGVVIVDEASMVGDKMRETILSMAKENNSRVIFIGDPGQLPPVENKDALGRPKMSEALESGFSSELTEVMRVSNGNSIIDVATAARKAQQTDLIIKHGDVAMSGYARRSSFNEIGGGFYVGEAGRANAIKSFIDKFFKSKLFASDPAYAKIIAYRNVSVDAYNDMVRSALGKTGIVEVGESLIGQDNLYTSTPGGGKRPLLLNGDEYTVVGVGGQEIIYSDAVPGVEIPVVRIDITTDSSDSAGGSFYLLSDYSDEKMDEIQGAILQKQADISRMYMDDKYMLKRARAAFYSSLRSDFVTLKNISNPNKLTEKDSDSLKQRMLRHGYAITTHKSQGSEFNNILVDDSDIRRMSGNLDDIFYKKALYTAITRAKDKAVIITNGDRYDAATGTKIPANEQNEVPSIMLNNDLLEQMASSEIRPSDNC